MMTYQHLLAYLDGVTNFERSHQPAAMRAVKLERMRQLCERLGHPQQRFRSILVGGTNGKGSIAAMIYEILRAGGLRVGLYTSPHLKDARERIRVTIAASSEALREESSDWISEEEMVAVMQRVLLAGEAASSAQPDGPPTYFELMTAAAFRHFAQRGVEIAVLEVGLGGRLDATNVVEPEVSLLGPISLDHTDVLGHDVVAIAREKAGIIRPQRVLISASQPSSVSALLHEATLSQDCRLIQYGEQIRAEILRHSPQGLKVTIHGLRDSYEDLSLPLVGRHQAENAAMAVAAVELLAESGTPRSAIRLGLSQTDWPGRIEVIQDHRLVVLDGAHNPHAAQTLRSTIEELWPNETTHLIVGMSADKSIHAMAECLLPLAQSVICAQSQHPRACEARQLAEQLRAFGQPAGVIADVVDAYTYVLNTSLPKDLIVVTGSLFLVGELRAALRYARSNAPLARALV